MCHTLYYHRAYYKISHYIIFNSCPGFRRFWSRVWMNLERVGGPSRSSECELEMLLVRIRDSRILGNMILIQKWSYWQCTCTSYHHGYHYMVFSWLSSFHPFLRAWDAFGSKSRLWHLRCENRKYPAAVGHWLSLLQRIRAFPPLSCDFRVSTEVTFGRGDLSVCPLGGFTWGQRNVLFLTGGVSPQGSPQGQTLRAPLLRGASVLHWDFGCSPSQVLDIININITILITIVITITIAIIITIATNKL